MRSDPDWAYKVLGVSRGDALETVKVQWRKLASLHHPDCGGDAAKFAEANHAWEQVCRDLDVRSRAANRPPQAPPNAGPGRKVHDHLDPGTAAIVASREPTRDGACRIPPGTDRGTAAILASRGFKP